MVFCSELGANDTYSSNSSTSNSTVKFGEKGLYLPVLYVFLAIAAAMLACLIALFNIYKHITNYTRPEFQKLLIRIIFIVPVYSSSCLSLAFPTYSLVVESIRDIWEAVVIYEFLRLILAYCGGESACIYVIMKNPGSISHLWPLNYCLPRIPLDAKFMRMCKRLTLQFVFIKPIMAIANIAMFYNCEISNTLYQFSQMIIYNVSYTLSLYGLLLFYFATHHHPSLASRKPIMKFLGVKLIIFATYYQGLAVQLIPGYDRHFLEALNNFIFCWEMIFFALLHVWAFGWFEFTGGGGTGIGEDGGNDDLEGGGIEFTPANGNYGISKKVHAADHSLALTSQEYSHPVSTISSSTNALKDAFDMQDLVADTRVNFDDRYAIHVSLGTSENNPEHNAALIAEEEEEEAAKHPFQDLAENTTKITEEDSRPQQPPTTTNNNNTTNTSSNPFQIDEY